MSTSSPFLSDNETNASCDNVQSNHFTSFNNLMYDPCNSKQRYKENIKQSEYQLGGATCNSTDNECGEGNCTNENSLLKEVTDIQDKLTTGTLEQFQHTRGYSTHGQSPQYFTDNNVLVDKDNALKRSCITNLNYINQYQAKNILATNDSEYKDLNSDETKEMGASLSFGNPIPNMVRYRPDDNYLNKTNVTSSASATNNDQQLLHNPRLTVRSKGTQYNPRIGLLDFTNDCTKPYDYNVNSFIGDNEYKKPSDNLCAFGIYKDEHAVSGPSYDDSVLRAPVDSNSIFYDMTYVNCSSNTNKNAIGLKLDSKLAPYNDAQLKVLLSKACMPTECR